MSNSWWTEALRWHGVILLVSWVFAPATHWLFHRFPDRGASVGRPFALLLWIWPTWFLAGVSPLPYTTAGLWITLFLLGGGLWYWAYRRDAITRDWLKTLLIVEAIAATAFFGYVGLRGYTPQIVWTEKAMDVAFLTASTVTRDVPPADPWFSGETINYYYLGYFIHGSIGRVAQVPTWTGYNLALAATATMTLVGAGGCAFNIARRWLGKRSAIAAATLAGFMVVFAGNMHAVAEFIKAPRFAIDQSWWGTVGWDSSRIVVDHGSSQEHTINEFPWFSLLLGDLHPHLTALPFTILAIALSIAVLMSTGATSTNRFERWMRLVVAGAVIGALYPLNSLDLPTYLVLFAGALVIRSGFNRRTALDLVVVAIGAVVCWLPFIVRFVPFAGGGESNLPDWVKKAPVLPRVFTTLGVYTGEHTSPAEFFSVFGLQWMIALTALITAVLTVRSRLGLKLELPRWSIAPLLMVIIVSLALPAPVLLLAGLPLVLALWLLVQAQRAGRFDLAVIPGLMAAAFGLIVITEFFYVEDSFQGRYNTLFKVYYQVWTLLGIACTVALVWMFARTAGKTILRVAFVSLTAVGLLAGAAYPLIATPQWVRVHGEREWQGLDGVAFMDQFSAGDVAAIRWLTDNAQENDVIIEAPGCSYEVNGAIPTGRLAAFTGVPDIIGWGFHEVQWRGGEPDVLNQITPRQQDVAAIYADPQSPLIDKYGATLLFVGSFEQSGAGPKCEIAGPFPSVLDPSFPGPGWTEVFSSDGSTIYRRTDEAAS